MFCGNRVADMMDEMTIRVAIRTTARISFVLFLGAFLGDALYRLMPAAATRWLKAKQRWVYLGLCGITHGASCVHSRPNGCNRTRARFERDHGRRVHDRVPIDLWSRC